MVCNSVQEPSNRHPPREARLGFVPTRELTGERITWKIEHHLAGRLGCWLRSALLVRERANVARDAYEEQCESDGQKPSEPACDCIRGDCERGQRHRGDQMY